jgi:transcriptional regulator with XRE-family HTH domain
VSKPTVWAWEHGKAKPVADRLDALAAALGVPAEDLATGRDSGGLSDLLARSRSEVARAFGVGADKVRIMLEL